MSEARERVRERYREKRERAQRRRDRRVEEVYELIPRLREINREVNRFGFDSIQQMKAEPMRRKEIQKELDEKFKELERETDELLDKHGIERDFKKCRYECMECEDTGYTPDGRMCRCFKQSIADEEYNSSNINVLLKKCSFDRFRLDYYPDEITDKHKESPRRNMERIYSRTVKFCEDFAVSEKSLMFTGPTGLGKTFLSCAAVGRLISDGYFVVYVRATKLFTIFEDNKFGRLGDRKVIDDLYGCDLLVIDDLGAEADSRFNLSYLFDIIDDRTSRGKKMIINTNLNLPDLERRYSARFTSRLVEHFQIFFLYGEDIRFKMI